MRNNLKKFLYATLVIFALTGVGTVLVYFYIQTLLVPGNGV
jgi:putative flippase GtrA